MLSRRSRLLPSLLLGEDISNTDGTHNFIFRGVNESEIRASGVVISAQVQQAMQRVQQNFMAQSSIASASLSSGVGNADDDLAIGASAASIMFQFEGQHVRGTI